MANKYSDPVENTSIEIENLLEGPLSNQVVPDDTLRDPNSLWAQLKDEIVHSYYELAGSHDIKREGKAIITAGSPGAGKTVALKGMQDLTDVDLDSFVTIDADDIKQLLLGNTVSWLSTPGHQEKARDHWDRLLERHGVLPDGFPLMRGELAFLVHKLSTSIHHIIYTTLAGLRCNLIVEGTLRWMPTSTSGVGFNLIKLFEENYYDSITIVAVNASESTCIQGATKRWTEKRNNKSHESRYTPVKAIKDTFIELSQDEGVRKISIPVINAQETHHFAHLRRTFSSLSLYTVHRDNTSSSLPIPNERSEYLQ